MRDQVHATPDPGLPPRRPTPEDWAELILTLMLVALVGWMYLRILGAL